MQNLLKKFEDNFLDGDKITDCGGAIFSADGAFDVAKYFYELGKKEGSNYYE